MEIFISKYDRILLAKKLKELRIGKKISRAKLAKLLRKDKQQIIRYEEADDNKYFQVPPLNVFANICSILQVDPKELLNIEKVDVDKLSETGIIYEWEIKSNKTNIFKNRICKKLEWICTLCKCRNIVYDFKISIFNSDGVYIYTPLKCEKCSTVFMKLYIGEKINE